MRVRDCRVSCVCVCARLIEKGNTENTESCLKFKTRHNLLAMLFHAAAASALSTLALYAQSSTPSFLGGVRKTGGTAAHTSTLQTPAWSARASVASLCSAARDLCVCVCGLLHSRARTFQASEPPQPLPSPPPRPPLSPHQGDQQFVHGRNRRRRRRRLEHSSEPPPHDNVHMHIYAGLHLTTSGALALAH